jgi:uncharacterized protein (TIGR02118 family)
VRAKEKIKMLKVYILIRRRSGMTHEEYVEHWRDKHASLFASQPDTKRYVRRYTQSRVTGDKPSGMTLGEVDGIVQLWFDDIDGFNAFAKSPSYLNVIKPDEERSTDPKRCEYFFTTEHPIIE